MSSAGVSEQPKPGRSMATTRWSRGDSGACSSHDWHEAPRPGLAGNPGARPEPRLPRGAQPVDEDERRSLAGLDVADLAVVDPHPPLMALPREVEPRGVAPAPVVGVRTGMQEAADGLDRAWIGHRGLRYPRP